MTEIINPAQQANPANYLAHVRQDGQFFVVHELEEHLRGVGQRAEEYAADFGMPRKPARLEIATKCPLPDFIISGNTA